jgi:hypothetical protein
MSGHRGRGRPDASRQPSGAPGQPGTGPQKGTGIPQLPSRHPPGEPPAGRRPGFPGSQARGVSRPPESGPDLTESPPESSLQASASRPPRPGPGPASVIRHGTHGIPSREPPSGPRMSAPQAGPRLPSSGTDLTASPPERSLLASACRPPRSGPASRRLARTTRHPLTGAVCGPQHVGPPGRAPVPGVRPGPHVIPSREPSAGLSMSAPQAGHRFPASGQDLTSSPPESRLQASACRPLRPGPGSRRPARISRHHLPRAAFRPQHVGPPGRAPPRGVWPGPHGIPSREPSAVLRMWAHWQPGHRFQASGPDLAASPPERRLPAGARGPSR